MLTAPVIVTSPTGSGTPAPTVGNELNTFNAAVAASINAVSGTALLPSGNATTDTANFVAAFAAAMANPVIEPGGSNYGTYIVINLGPGIFYINAAQAMMVGTIPTVKVSGLVFKGQGSDVTWVNYNPSVSGPLCQNRRVLNLQFLGITFYGQDANSDFMQSQEQNGYTNIQSFNYHDVIWDGSWRNIGLPTGGNNNSEWRFERCTVSCSTVSNWIYTPPAITATYTASNPAIAITNPTAGGYEPGTTISVATTVGNVTAGGYQILTNTGTAITIAPMTGASVGSQITPNTNGTSSIASANDQILNFWFSACKFWSTNGSWLTLNYGGAVKIYQSDVSGWQPTTNTYLFNLLGSSHAYGVCFFLADGMRVEHKSDYALLMQCYWNQGAVCFALLDQSSQVSNRNPANVYCVFNSTNVAGPNIEFRQCELIGNHSYVTASNNYTLESAAIYRNCDMLQSTQFAGMIAWTGSGSGGAPNIRAEDCRSGNVVSNTTIVYDSDLFAWSRLGGPSNVKTFNFSGPLGSLPFSGLGSLNLLYPQKCALVRLRLYKAAGGAGGAYSYNVQSTDATPVVYGNFAGSNAAAAIYTSLDIFVQLSTSTLWTFQIVDAQGRTSPFYANLLIDHIW